MKILPIINNQNKTNFKGTVDKSVVKYLKEFRTDALKKRNGFYAVEIFKVIKQNPYIAVTPGKNNGLLITYPFSEL